jgi:hypothetical protein
MYHWFFLLEITVVKIMNSLNVCSAHSYLYLRSRFPFKQWCLQFSMSQVISIVVPWYNKNTLLFIFRGNFMYSYNQNIHTWINKKWFL